MESAEFLARYTCELCGKRYVVPDLARGCENKHIEED
jgi:hypothetical protein